MWVKTVMPECPRPLAYCFEADAQHTILQEKGKAAAAVYGGTTS